MMADRHPGFTDSCAATQRVACSADDIFEGLRGPLTGTSYQILGSWADAEDVVQATWSKWRASHATVEQPRAWLTKVTVRASIDALRARQGRREVYPGEWLPEPASLDRGPEDLAVERSDLAVGVLVMLESLSPLERAVFVLRRGFVWSYEDISVMLGRSTEAIRQLDHRARQHLQHKSDRFVPDSEQAQLVTERFLSACAGGSIEALMEILAPDVVLHSDSGGEAKAPPQQIVGASKVARFFIAIVNSALTDVEAHLVDVNGITGLLTTRHGVPVSAVTFDVGEGRITHLYLLAAPSKLRRLHLQPGRDR